MINNNIFLILILLGILIALGVIIYFTSKKKWRRVYKQKGTSLLNDGEKRFFDVLAQAVTPQMYICPKVRIADLVTMAIDKSDKDYWPMLNKITQKHVDFVICDRATFNPLLIVELDGGSHNEKNRSLRDELVDNVFGDVNIPMLHVHITRDYQISEISRQISEAINNSKIKSL